MHHHGCGVFLWKETIAMNMRIEKDSLGEIQVPAQALYGAQTQRAVLNFDITGRHPYRAFIWSVAIIKRSAAEVNAALSQLDSGKAKKIVQAAMEVEDGKWDSEFVVDPIQAGAGTSHNMNANEVIANRATVLLGGALGEYLIRPNDDVNMAQSTNDVIPAAIRLGCLWRMEELLGAIHDLAQAFHQKATAFDAILKSGRTHLQDAVPVRLGQEFEAYACAIERDGARIRAAADNLRRLGIGGTATGTGLNAHPEYHARMVAQLSANTRLELTVSDNLFESMQSMADAAAFSASLRVLALTLTRIANDLRLMASGPSSGLDELRFPALQPGSSIMPGKINPVIAEMLNMAMYHVIGLDQAVAMAAQAGQFELNVMMPLIAHELFEIMHVMIAAMKAFTTRGIAGLQANPERMAAWLEKNAIVATALNPLIGYMAAAQLVKEAVATDRSIRQIAMEKTAQGALRHKDQDRAVTEGEIEAALGNLRKMTDGGLG
jgi:aspartate ammonia-lyase